MFIFRLFSATLKPTQYFILFFLLLGLGLPVLGQQWSFGAGFHRGFIWKQSEGTGHLIENHPQGFVFSFSRPVSGSKSWHQAYGLPEVGINLRSFLLQQPALGNVWSASPFISFPIKETERSKLRLKSEMGLGYCSQPYHPIDNNKNTMLGTSLNYMIQFGLDYELSLWKGLAFQSGINVVHFSNANFRLPNKGLNMFYFEVGLNYRLKEEDFKSINNLEIEPIERTWSLSLAGSLGFNGALPFDRKTYPSYHFITYLSKRFNSKSSINFGLDYFHNLGTKETINSSWDLRGKEKPDFRKAGLTLGHELWFGRMAALTQIGVYIYQPYEAPSLIYSRVGLKYQITDHFFGFMTVKFHKGQSEVAEWGLGYRINKRR